MIMNVLQSFLEKGVQVRAIKEGYELGDNIQSKVLAFAFGLSAEIERRLISQRTKAGLARVRALGKHIGRPKGRKSKCKLSRKGAYIRRERAKGRTKSDLARELKVSRTTLLKYMKKLRID
jgi:DNA invertase Pin-like site-specific DNA recombinase